MGIQKKAKAAPAPATVTQVEAETQDEIEQIMNEIDQLQQGMSPGGTPQAKAPAASAPKLKVVTPAPADEPAAEVTAEPAAGEPNVMEEFHASGGDAPSMEETLGDLKEEEPAGPSLLDQTIETEQETQAEEPVAEAVPELDMAAVEEGEVEMTDQNETEGGTLTMTLTGNMTLKLKYEYDGQEVTVGFKDHALRVQLSDGTEFKIPVKRISAPIKRAA